MQLDEQQSVPPAQPEEDREFWGATWQADHAAWNDSPDAVTWPNEVAERHMEFLRPYLPSEGTVAELGCGSARLLARIGRERPGLKLVAVDYEETAVELAAASARTFGVTIETHLGDVNDLEFPDESFDMVLSGGLLEHFPDPKPALQEMVRTLKPGGSFYAGVVPRKWFSLHRPMHRWRGPQVYRTKYGAHDYGRWLRELGMVDVHPLTRGVYPPLFHHLPAGPRQAIERRFRPLDGTKLADRLGYFFVVGARKPR